MAVQIYFRVHFYLIEYTHDVAWKTSVRYWRVVFATFASSLSMNWTKDATTLASFVNMKHYDWDQHLSSAVFAINTERRSSTRLSPFQLLYDRLVVLPCETALPWKTNTWDTDVHQRQVKMWQKTAHRLLLISQKWSKSFRQIPKTNTHLPPRWTCRRIKKNSEQR